MFIQRRDWPGTENVRPSMKRKLRDYGPRLLKLSRSAEETGFSLVEVLVAGLVIGVAVIGVSMMFGTGSAWVAALGEDRVGVGLAQQRIEQVRADTISRGWNSSSVTVAVPGKPIPPEAIDPANCDVINDQPAGCRQIPKYQRVTCIQYVSDTDITSPAYSSDCAAGEPTSTRRVTVTVTPVFVDDSLANNNVQRAYVVTLQGWITRSGK
jgi:type II secretory pathway pseudopilin PulG